MFVESLDKCFESVCELDIIFNADKVHYVLHEVVMGGMVLETDMVRILHAYHEQEELVKREDPLRTRLEDVWSQIKRKATSS